MWQDIKESIIEVLTSEIMVKALNTFWQAFLAVAILDIEGIMSLVFSGDWNNAYILFLAAVIAGLAAGMSAVKTYVRQLINNRK